MKHHYCTHVSRGWTAWKTLYLFFVDFSSINSGGNYCQYYSHIQIEATKDHVNPLRDTTAGHYLYVGITENVLLADVQFLSVTRRGRCSFLPRPLTIIWNRTYIHTYRQTRAAQIKAGWKSIYYYYLYLSWLSPMLKKGQTLFRGLWLYAQSLGILPATHRCLWGCCIPSGCM